MIWEKGKETSRVVSRFATGRVDKLAHTMNPNEKDYGSLDFQLKGKLLKPKEAISRKYWSDLEPEIRGNDERITPKDTDHFSVTIPAKSLTRIIFTIDP